MNPATPVGACVGLIAGCLLVACGVAPEPTATDAASEEQREINPAQETEQPHDWPVTDGYSFGFDWLESDDLNFLARESTAVVLATMIETSEPEIVIEDLPDPPLETGNTRDVLLFQMFRVDELLAGDGVAVGGQYAFPISAGTIDNKPVQFWQDPIPRPGDQLLLFLRLNPGASTSGIVRSVGVHTGRISIEEVVAQDLRIGALEWRDLVGNGPGPAKTLDAPPTVADWEQAPNS